ncbi:MAG: response regulator [Nitrososphaerota archaeon]
MKLLVIDDNKDLTEAIYDSLDSPDIECKMINDGQMGLDEILKERGKYNLILLDIAMPNFSGMDILQKLKKENILKSENIIIFTASSITDRDIDDFVSSGAKGVLKKPVSLDDLIELVEKYRSDD